MFDVFYIGENKQLQEQLPFAKQIESINAVKANTKMFWLIEPNIELNDFGVFEFRPPSHDQVYEHVWKWDSINYGGLRLLPSKESLGIKEVNKVVCKKKFDILHTKTPGKYFEKNAYATHVWCVDKDYRLNDDIDWAPSNFEPNFIHSFHLRGQLEHKYPAEEGGIKLYPRDWKKSDIKYHAFLDASAKYPVMYVDDPEDYTQRDVYSDEYVWLIDNEYQIEESSIDWVPNPFEQEYIHSFRMPNQLQEKSWSYKHETDNRQLGGIRLVPKDWRKATGGHEGGGVIIHKDCPIDDKTFDVYYIDEDDFTADQYEELAQRSKSDWFWVVDREYDFNGKLLFVPQSHELEYIHVFKIPGMLEERYPVDITEPWDNRCGGVRLVNKNFDMTKHKYQEGIVPVKYDIFYTDDPKQYSTFARKSKTKMFWIIDKEYQLDNNFKIVVPKHEQKFILNYQIDQLHHKYPEKEGGIYLVPKSANSDTQIKYKGTLGQVYKRYPVLRVDDVNELKGVTEDCWVVDQEYQVEDSKLTWMPNVFEKTSIHTFHVGQQLRDKYPESMGGVRWVPVDWDGNYVVHETLDNVEKQYPVKFVEDPSHPPSINEPQWLIDQSYRITDKINWVPGDYDKDKVHVFHVHEQLTSKYTENMGGVYWWPGNAEGYEIKVHEEPLRIPVQQYPVYFVDNVNDLSGVTEACWLVDNEYELEDTINVIPWQNEQEREMIHTFHVRGQLEHKFPESMGGVRWVPGNNSDVEIKIHEVTPFGDNLKFEVFASEEEGRKKSQTGWFWVIDPDVDLLPEFTLDFVPKVWDKGKKHVWQKLNPKTGRQYDYSGVSLCHKQPAEKGRPKFIREPACTQREYPVYHLEASDYTGSLDAAYRRLCAATDTSMFWVVDLHTQLTPDFSFDYYPTQYDQGYMHVFLNEDGEHKNVRLVPKELFEEWEYTDEQILNNSLGNLKLMTVEASMRPKWPIIRLDDYNKNNFISELESYRDGYETGEPVPFVWSVDPDADIDIQGSPVKLGFSPKVSDINKVHCWQKVNDQTNQVHGYGGLRLWATNVDYSNLTTEALRLNKIKNVQYVREYGSITQNFDVVFISYNEPNADKHYKILEEKINAVKTVSKKPINLHWVKDVDGIFNAHQQAANLVSSKMFWVVDGDAELVPDFDFSYLPDVYDEDVVHVWNSINVVNGLEYGYGGVKLFPTQMVRDATSWGLDFTTGLSNRFKAMPNNSCYTRFNTDAFSTWRSAFRECVKLSLNSDSESKERLDAWMHPIPDAQFRHDAKRGAEEAVAFVNKHKDDAEALSNINNFEWLKNYYEQNNS